jgi:phosphopantetheine--protein transferase-like protein
MDRQSILRQTIAEFLGTESSQIGSDLPLTGSRFQGSLARTQLYAAIQQQLGVKCRAVYTARTYGELQAAVLGTTTDGSEVASNTSGVGNGRGGFARHHTPTDALTALACGIDIEMVDHFPEAQDYWEDPFYKTAFTSAEIAYCLMQEHPRIHFAARWCAKEALKKCDPAYIHEDLGRIEVAFAEGAPFLRQVVNGRAEPLPFAVSLSHTPALAAAVIVKSTASRAASGTASEAFAETSLPVSPRPVTEAAMASPSGLVSGVWPLLLLGVTLMLSLWALLRTF